MVFNMMVIDDSEVMRSMIIKTIRLSGLPLGDLHEAENGKVALQLLEHHWIDLALVDINMPEMNGEELIERIRANPEIADLAIVVVSTESSETRIERIRKMGAAFIHKPFTPEILRNTVRQITGVTDEQLRQYSGESLIQNSGPDF